jgi:outer membrane protein OmpA-like peptidoglycan-associated protein
MSRFSRAALLLCFAVAFGHTSTVAAQQQNIDLGGDDTPDLNVQNFSPTPSPYGIFSLDSAQGSSHLQVSGGLLLNFAKDPLIVEPENGEAFSIVEQQLAADLLFAIGLFDMIEVGFDLPVYFVNTAAVNNVDIQGATIGDLLIRPKFTLLNTAESPLGVALYANVGIPTGDTAAFTSSGTFSVKPGVVVDTQIDKLLLAFNLGFNVQEERTFGTLAVGSEMTFGFGAQYEVVDNFMLIGGEVFGSSAFNNFFSEEVTPLEGLIGLKLRTSYGLNFTLGGGGGIVAGYGSPSLRVIGGVQYANFDDDWDDDGILNNADACPREAEDRDLFEDEDGCPDPDNDQDNILDVEDNCPNEPEDVDSFEDEDGCPDPDNDQDGIADVNDECPLEPGVPEEKGCPSKDRDGDGLNDDEDKCPDDPEDKDGFEDEDGCPDTDNDKDGIFDVNDGCPNKPEDKDGFKDEDGCPDLDNDSDGFPDNVDKCPNEAEVLNGFKDDDGCPDKGKPIVTKDLKILQRVFFDTGKATIKKKSFPLLNAVSLVLKGNPGITLVEVQGHTDDVGNDNMNMKLSDARANAVRNFLVGKGIDATRLRAKGYGETQPAQGIDSLRGGNLRKARDKNRRVQFEILKRDGGSDVKTR